ncbi:hypothetical protein RB195_004321 [Necator americanus]|uniref:Transmembrane protein n=1 Tax=Necator americanus TaxID=51031 RepID=A0ABR1BKW9_NECAM
MASEESARSLGSDQASWKSYSSRMTAGNTVKVYYYIGDGYRDMFVAIGFLLGSIAATAAFAAYNYVSLALGFIIIFFKIFVGIVAYLATAKKNGKLMIFVAICAGLASAATVYIAVTAFTDWAEKDFDLNFVPYVAQIMIDIAVFVHVTYFAIILL